MWRRRRTGGWRSQTRSNPAPMWRRQIRSTARPNPSSCLDRVVPRDSAERCRRKTGTRPSQTRSNPAPVWWRQIRGTPPLRHDAQAEGCPARQAMFYRLHSPPRWPSPEWDRGETAGRCRSKTGDGEAGPVRIPPRCGGAEYGNSLPHPNPILRPEGLRAEVSIPAVSPTLLYLPKKKKGPTAPSFQ